MKKFLILTVAIMVIRSVHSMEVENERDDSTRLYLIEFMPKRVDKDCFTHLSNSKTINSTVLVNNCIDNWNNQYWRRSSQFLNSIDVNEKELLKLELEKQSALVNNRAFYVEYTQEKLTSWFGLRAYPHHVGRCWILKENETFYKKIGTTQEYEFNNAIKNSNPIIFSSTKKVNKEYWNKPIVSLYSALIMGGIYCWYKGINPLSFIKR